MPILLSNATKVFIESFVLCSISIESAISLLVSADFFKMALLIKECQKYIIEHIKELSKTKATTQI